jgi:hypothetical protein
MPVPVPQTERTGVLVIRAWIETNGEERLRARITQTIDIDQREQSSTIAATPDEITKAVSLWISALTKRRGDEAVTHQ